MRISNEVLSNMTTQAMSNSYNTYVNTINKILSGKNFTKVSENPGDATKVMKLDNQISQLNTYQNNIQAATNEMDLTYTTLGAIEEQISSIDGLVLQAANSSTTPDAAKAIASEIKQRVATIQDKLNTKYLDNYIFAGTYVQTAPFQENNDGIIEYKGSSKDSGDRKLTISENTKFVYNITGETLFGKTEGVEVDEETGEKTYGSDFFSQMKELDDLLNADALDYDKIRAKLDIIDKTSNTITQTQGIVSSKVSKLDSTKELNENTIMNLTENKVDLEEVDIIKAASDLASAQTAMQASYLLGTRVLSNVSLLDYLQ